MLATLSVSELAAWEEFDTDEPIGPREHRQQMAILLASITNRWRRPGTQPIHAEDFLIRRVVDVEKAKKAHLIDTLKAMARPAAERPRHRKHPKSAKAAQKALKRKAARK